LAKYVATDQAAKFLGVLPAFVNHLIYDSRVKAMKVGRDWLGFFSSNARP